MATKLTQASAFVCADGTLIRAVVYDLDTLERLWECEYEVPNFAMVAVAASNAMYCGKISRSDYLEISTRIGVEQQRWQMQAINRCRPRYLAIATWLAIGAATVLFWGAAVYGVCKAIGG